MKNAYINYINEARSWKGHEEIKKKSLNLQRELEDQ